MAEEKPHDASPTKLRKARSEGNVAKSAELSGAFSFAAGGFTALGLVPFFVPIFRDWFSTAARGAPVSWLPAFKCAVLLSVPMIVSGVVGALVSMVQTGGPVTKPLKFEPNKLNPVNGIKKMVGKEGIVNALKAFICFVLAAAALRPIVEEVFSRGITNVNPIALALVAQSAIIRIIGELFVIGIAFGVLDFYLTRKRWKDGLKMTHEEMKRDYKENNGDPQIKGKRKQFHRQLMRGSPTRVKDATMVVTNPTHFAVAMEYRPPQVPVPRIVCRAADEMAFEVRRLAEFFDVPIIENVELARTLFARGRSGREIPQDTYFAVAEIVAALSKETVAA